MKKLILFTNEFLYGTWEPYLEEETKYYNGFGEIIICSLQLRDDHANSIRKLDIPCKIVPVRYISRWRYFLGSFTVLHDFNLYKEILILAYEKKLTFGTLIDLFVFFSRAYHEAREIDKILEDLDKKNIVLYSYRFEYQPYVAILLKKMWKLKGKIICRAHGYDLYENRHKNNYIPMRKVILKAVDAVYPCSMDGVSYLRGKFPEYAEKVEVRYLGTKDHGLGLEPERKGKYRIVSCSGVTKVKRIDRIVDALALINDMDIEWTHYGDGPLFDELKEYAAAKLNGNIVYVLKGNVENDKLMEEYRRVPYDLFINVSSSEGVPVSIMEALSFGIPCIATNVGGTREIITDFKNGVLLKADFESNELAEWICRFINMTEEEYQKYRRNARDVWSENYSAERNYDRFCREIAEV